MMIWLLLQVMMWMLGLTGAVCVSQRALNFEKSVDLILLADVGKSKMA